MWGGSAQVVQKLWVFMLLFLSPFKVECSSVNNIIIMMVKDTVSQRHANIYVNNSKDIFAPQVRWNVKNTPVPAGTLSALLWPALYLSKQLWATKRGMVFKVLSLKQDKNFTINFSILNTCRVSFCSGSLALCLTLGWSLRARDQGFSPGYYEYGPSYFHRKIEEK